MPPSLHDLICSLGMLMLTSLCPHENSSGVQAKLQHRFNGYTKNDWQRMRDLNPGRLTPWQGSFPIPGRHSRWGRLASQAHQHPARPPPTSQGAKERMEPPSFLPQLCARAQDGRGWVGRVCIPYSGRPPQGSLCCLAHHSVQSPGLEAQSGVGNGLDTV